MSKLSYLADGHKITIATDNEPFIMRDLCRNDTAARYLHIINADPADPDGSGITDLSGLSNLGSNNSVHVSYGDAAQTTDAECISMTVAKVGSGFQISYPTDADLDTPAKLASIGYGDDKRTTYPNLFEFAKQVAQNADLQTHLASNFTLGTACNAVIIDQVNEVVQILGDGPPAVLVNLTHMATVELDDSASIQFGE